MRCACVRACVRACGACVCVCVCVCVWVHLTDTFRGVAFLSVISLLARELHGVYYILGYDCCVLLSVISLIILFVLSICALRDLM